ncbi:uncharacterized protein LOC126815411 [Patella vulgata]|uniref:uncharacterized protein LOC126815411 n=1 Tax=Patella vulgata TaxID=6465 RepID=UPI002180522A|nr:uncharacterized protein LOC126815411 [Patella vulgata]
MAEINTADLKIGIKEILKDADLDTLSAKKVRKMLEVKFEADLTDRKQEIDKMVMEQISQTQNGEDSESESPAANGTSKNNSADSTMSSSDDDDMVLDKGPVRKKKKVSKKITAVNDEEFAKQLQQQELGRTRGSRRPPKPTKPKTPKVKSDKKRKSTYSKPCQLSAELAAIVGADQLPRSDVVKKMWEIAKARNLQDPKNKQFMLCDDELKKVFGRRRVRMFGMMKDLHRHIIDMKDL